MSGGWQTYRCERCPLVIELGGSTTWDENGVVYAETIQIACAECGTLHRIIEECGSCQVSALAGPVRSAHSVILRDITGVEIETQEWVTEDDWEPVGRCEGGINALGQVSCNCCGCVGRMLSHESVLYPNGHEPGRLRSEECPVCLGPMECIGVTDAI